MLRPERLVAEVVRRIRYNFGTAGGEISGERTCKRRSAKHLVVLPLQSGSICAIACVTTLGSSVCERFHPNSLELPSARGYTD
jgi:hypothetical protein